MKAVTGWQISGRTCMVELLYWRDVKTTGVVFGASLLLLLSLTVCSIVSVCSYIGLALLSVTICFRIYKGILQAIQKSDEGHPFKQYLGQEVALSDDTVHKYSDVVLEKLNKTIEELRRLFLVEDLVDSIKGQIDHYLALVNNQIKDVVGKGLELLHPRCFISLRRRSREVLELMKTSSDYFCYFVVIWFFVSELVSSVSRCPDGEEEEGL
ncbi:hypothetical protein GOODEAATRI_007067 [Goodea atripinnis]|uniref:Reticulon n=1 Tax=Goodea atripinnis TaxID=208336 RepID=A0ABV0P238_9TELE